MVREHILTALTVFFLFHFKIKSVREQNILMLSFSDIFRQTIWVQKKMWVCHSVVRTCYAQQPKRVGKLYIKFNSSRTVVSFHVRFGTLFLEHWLPYFSKILSKYVEPIKTFHLERQRQWSIHLFTGNSGISTLREDDENSCFVLFF